MEKHHSCLNSHAIIEYFQENFPKEIGRLLEGLGPEIQALPDPVGFLTETNNWVSSDVIIRLFENAKKITGDDHIVHKMGSESSARKKFSYIQRILLFAYRNPRRSLKRIQAINDKFAKNKTIEVVKTTRDTATHPPPLVQGHPRHQGLLSFQSRNLHRTAHGLESSSGRSERNKVLLRRG